MAEVIKVSKQDILWGYFAQFFSIASGIIILPMILKKFSAEEVGMNYLMLSVAQFVSLVDLGFSPQLGRNVTYIYSGAQRLLKSGVDKLSFSEQHFINYRLLATLIQTARWIYQLMAGLVLFVMLTGGTAYIYHITKGFSNISNSLWIWLIYTFSVFFQIYYSYYSALLTGSGKIKESKKAMVYSNIVKILLTYLLLFYGCGLLGVVIANFLYPFLTRYLSYRYYFTPELKRELSFYKTSFSEKLVLFKIIWYNSKRQGLVSLSNFVIYNVPLILMGMYLPLNDMASYGLMLQLVGVVMVFSSVVYTTYLPRFASLYVSNDIDALKRDVSYGLSFFYLFYTVGIICLIAIGPMFIDLLDSKTVLPPNFILIIFSISRLLDLNFWNLSQVLIAKNELPFLKSCLSSGLLIVLCCFITLAFFQGGLLEIILITGVVMLLLVDWYWSIYVLRFLDLNLFSLCSKGYKEICLHFQKSICFYRTK